jgi:hypothetical protein
MKIFFRFSCTGIFFCVHLTPEKLAGLSEKTVNIRINLPGVLFCPLGRMFFLNFFYVNFFMNPQGYNY